MLKKSSLNNFILIMVVILFSSCYKNRLKKDKEILIGEWEWAYSIKSSNCGCSAGTRYYDTLTPLTEGATYSMEYKKKGKVFFYKNDLLINKKRIVFSSWNRDSGLGRRFNIKLNNNKDSTMRGNIDSKDVYGIKDSIEYDSYFPFKNSVNCSPFNCYYTHLFVKK